MFDKLIESDSTGAEFKNRRNYFMVSSIVVGILFLSAVVFSIYAAEIGLGTDEFELSTILPPVSMPEAAPEPPVTKKPNDSETDKNTLPIRQPNIARIEEHQTAPSTTSVTPNTQMSRPIGRYTLGDIDTNPATPPGSGRENVIGSSSETVEPSGEPEIKTRVPPPPVNKSSERKVIRSPGPINGKAIYLPKPPYPAHAAAIGVSGNVDVQVTIDETGKVISAKAVSGHPFLRGPAEKAAWSARFSPTYLGPTPVKVTGVIVYKFSRN